MSKRNDFNMRMIDLMMSIDKQAPSERKDAVMKALAQSLDTEPRKPWYRRIFRRRR